MFAFGWPKRVKVHREKKGGSGHSCKRSLIVPTMPRNSTQMAIECQRVSRVRSVLSEYSRNRRPPGR